ncbi:hypothetical protein L218DRAFT_1080958, partial [Marasmius fiardii PR-910]
MVKHIVLHTVPAWGHSKPLTSVMVEIAESRPDVVLTFLTNAMYPKIMAQLAKLPRERWKLIKNRI